MPETKILTLRLPKEQFAELEAIAAADGVPMAEWIRQAIGVRIEQLRQDVAFQDRLRANLKRNEEVIARLIGQ